MSRLNWKVEREARDFVSDYSLLVENEKRNVERMQYLKDKHSLTDRKIQDLQHDIEFSVDYSMEEKMEFFDKLSNVTKERRVIKDRIDFYRQVNLFYTRGMGEENFKKLENKINGMIQSKSVRKYKKRVSVSEAV